MAVSRKLTLIKVLTEMGTEERSDDDKLTEMASLLHLFHSVLSFRELLEYLKMAKVDSMSEASDHVSLWNGSRLVEVIDFPNTRLYDEAKFQEGKALEHTQAVQELKLSAMEFASSHELLD